MTQLAPTQSEGGRLDGGRHKVEKGRGWYDDDDDDFGNFFAQSWLESGKRVVMGMEYLGDYVYGLLQDE